MLALVVLAGCSADHSGRHDSGAHDLVGPPRPVATTDLAPTAASTASTATSAPATGSSAPTAGAGRASNGSGAASSGRPGSAARPRSAGGGGPAVGGGAALPADVAACRLLTVDVAGVVLAPQRLARSTDVDSVCAYTASDRKTLVDIGDLALTRGQSAGSVLAGELSDRNRSGYRASRITLDGRVAAVLEDGRPHVAQLVWVQRGRVLTLTVSPATASSTTRLQQAATTISARFG